MKYRKKPVVIEAFRFGEKTPAWWREAIINGTVWNQGGVNPYATIKTLEGEMRANDGDWIIRGVKGELYPCRADIFEATYEPAA